MAALCVAALTPESALSQSIEPGGAVCRAPSEFCGRTVQSTCLSTLGAGAVDAQVASLECRNQFETYRDCLSLVARQCGEAPPRAPMTPAPEEATADAPASPTMLAIWREVKDSGDADALDAFADAYPTSPLATLARNRALALRDSAERPAPAARTTTSDADAQRALSTDALTRARNREAQAHLARTGYAPGLADGVWGRKSAAALAAFSEDNGLPATGTLTDAHLAALRAAPAAAPRVSPIAAPRQTAVEAPSAARASPPAEAPAVAPDAASDTAPDASRTPATLTVQVHYKKGLTFLSERCRVAVTRSAGGGFDLDGVALDCVAPIRLSGTISADGALRGAGLTYDGLHQATLSGDAAEMKADFGLIGPRDIMRIHLDISTE